MDYPEYHYIDYAFGGAQNRNHVIDINRLPAHEGKTDCYRTIFRFGEDYLSHYQNNNKSVKFYNGKCYFDWMPIDIDNKDLGEAHRMTSEIIDILAADFDIEVRYLFFSGAKGFHILLPSRMFGNVKPSMNLPKILKGVAADLMPEYYDSTIYDINRLFRLNNTINSKSGLYKISLSMEEFNSGIDRILELAKGKRPIQCPGLYDVVVNKQLAELFRKYSDKLGGENKSNGDAKKIHDFGGKIDWEKIRHGVSEGERDTYAAKYAGILRANNVSKEVAFNLLCGWNNGNNPPMEEEQVEKVVNSIYRYENNASELSKDIVPIWSVYDQYKEFVRSKKKVNIGIPEIDSKIRGIRPGQVLTMMGYTGNFKSATLQWILRHYTIYSGEPVLLFELEMTRLDLFERALQMEIGIPGAEIEKQFKEYDPVEVVDIVKGKLPNYYIVDIPYLSFEKIEQYTLAAEQEVYKRKTGLIGIDFIQLMAGGGRTNVDRVDHLAKQMKTFAKKLDVPVIVLSQVTGISDPTTPISLNDSRDSKTIEHMSDFVIGIWSGGEDKQILGLLKNRKGALYQVSRKVDKKTLKFE